MWSSLFRLKITTNEVGEAEIDDGASGRSFPSRGDSFQGMSLRPGVGLRWSLLRSLVDLLRP